MHRDSRLLQLSSQYLHLQLGHVAQNGRKAAGCLLECCRRHGSRFSYLPEQPCTGLLRSSGGEVQGVLTPSSRYSLGTSHRQPQALQDQQHTRATLLSSTTCAARLCWA